MMMTMTTTTDLTLISRAMERLVKFCIFRFFIMIGETYIFKLTISVTRLGDLLDFGHFLKPLATIILPKSPTFVGNFCKGVKIYHFSIDLIFGQLL